MSRFQLIVSLQLQMSMGLLETRKLPQQDQHLNYSPSGGLSTSFQYISGPTVLLRPNHRVLVLLVVTNVIGKIISCSSALYYNLLYSCAHCLCGLPALRPGRDPLTRPGAGGRLRTGTASHLSQSRRLSQLGPPSEPRVPMI